MVRSAQFAQIVHITTVQSAWMSTIRSVYWLINWLNKQSVQGQKCQSDERRLQKELRALEGKKDSKAKILETVIFVILQLQEYLSKRSAVKSKQNEQKSKTTN